jgi:hypothetical protein
MLLLGINPFLLSSQQVNTLYFMDNVPVRHLLNPSFQPIDDFYLSLPVIGLTQFSIGNNSLSLKDIIYNVNGQTVSFLSPLGNIPRFFTTLKSNTLIQGELQTTLLSVGFRNNSSYWTFSLTEKLAASGNLPKDLFRISLFGTPDNQNNSFDFTKLENDISIYTEAALGYSKKIDDRWTIGGKIKLLLGSANLSNTNTHFMLQAGVEQWNLKGEGTANYSGPLQINTANSLQSFTYTAPSNGFDWIKPSGIGAGIDAGCEYRYNDHLKLSGAINDLGFIRWTGNAHNYQYSVDYSFSGINIFNSNSTINTFQAVYNQLIQNNGLVDTMITAFSSSTKSKLMTNSYITATTAKINLGAEYSLLNDKLSFGFLSYSQLIKNILIEEMTGSVNTRPFKRMNATLSYSILNGRFSTLGAGFGFNTGIFNWFAAADYIPFQTAKLSLSTSGSPKINIPIPYNSTRFDFSAGMNIVFDKKSVDNKKKDRTYKNQNCHCDWN